MGFMFLGGSACQPSPSPGGGVFDMVDLKSDQRHFVRLSMYILFRLLGNELNIGYRVLHNEAVLNINYNNGPHYSFLYNRIPMNLLQIDHLFFKKVCKRPF